MLEHNAINIKETDAPIPFPMSWRNTSYRESNRRSTKRAIWISGAQMPVLATGCGSLRPKSFKWVQLADALGKSLIPGDVASRPLLILMENGAWVVSVGEEDTKDPRGKRQS